MKKLATILSIFLISPTTYALQSEDNNSNEKLDFSDPTTVYSSLEASYGTEGASIGFGLATGLSESWALLSKIELKEDADIFRGRAAAISTEKGSGILVDYIWNNNYFKEDLDSHTLVLSALQVLPFNDKKTLIVPIAGVGVLSNELSSNTSVIAMAQLALIHNFSDSIWMNVTPQYTYSFNDLKMEYENSKFTLSQRNFELEAFVGYKFFDTQNVKLQYKLTLSEEHQYWASYTFAF